jgi:poly-gamma-glutamate synthesis protein (capsule biosynthesis protein)
MMDCGEAGMRDTISALDRMNILHTGAGENLDGARRPVVLQMGDIELVILAYCERPPAEFYADGSKAGIAPFVLKDVISDIKKYGGPDSRVILSLHWGIEQTRMPQPYQVRLAHQLIQAGAEAIIGHHPHWPQGIEVYRNRPIIYSLGNYVNGFCNEIEQDNISAALHYSRGRMTHVEIIPLGGKNREIRFQPHVLKGKEAHEHLKYMDSLSRPLGTRIIIEKDRGYIKIR